MEAMPLFEGYEPSIGPMPLALEFENTGPDAAGSVSIQGDGYQMNYPIELPRGARKRLVAYPNVNYGGLEIVLNTNRGRLRKQFSPSGPMDNSRQVIVLLSDNPGELAFLKHNSNSSSRAGSGDVVRMQDAYCKPEFAPARAVGYAGVACVMLGAGSERLSDATVEALKLWTMTGGNLVFVGGASAPVLSDPRWQTLIPVKNPQVRTLEQSEALAGLASMEAPGPLSVLTGKPVPGSLARNDNGVPLVVEQGVGVGRVYYLAFNPMEPPLNRWPGLKPALMRILRPQDVVRARTYVHSFSGESAQYAMASSGMPPGSPYPTVPSNPAFEDPFSTKLPPVEQIAKILCGYFLVVVPLNFLILRKLKRGELAWFTAPIISLGFAGVLFQSAQGLYSAKMSTATQGVLVAHAGIEEAMFIGTSQMFVPKSGGYDLQMRGVDSLGQQNPLNQFGHMEQNEEMGELDPVDVGDQVLVPDMKANNLAFRQVTFRQRFPASRWFNVETRRLGNSRVRCTVRNDSQFTLEDGRVLLGSNERPIKELKPGESVVVEGLIQPRLNDTPGPQDLRPFVSRYQQVALVGMLRSFRPGPQLGQEVGGRTRIRLAYFAQGGESQ
jgi:hypothetical protein